MCCYVPGFSELPGLSWELAGVGSCPCSYLKSGLGQMAKVDPHMAVTWELSWDCQPEHHYVAAPCDLTFPQCGRRFQQGVSQERVF